MKNSKELEEKRKEDLYNMVKQLQALQAMKTGASTSPPPEAAATAAGIKSARGATEGDKEGNDEEENKNKCLRDAELSKTELAKIEKKEWGDLKDLVFETEMKVLDYLAFHAQRQRQFKKQQKGFFAFYKDEDNRKAYFKNSTVEDLGFAA